MEIRDGKVWVSTDGGYTTHPYYVTNVPPHVMALLSEDDRQRVARAAEQLWLTALHA